MGLVLGFDVSTTATKAVLVDGDGVVRGIGQSAYGLSTPRPLWSEQDPADWWTGAVAAIRTVLAETGARADEVEGIGLTGQMHGAVLLDASDEVLRPAILWNDQRTAAECDLIRAAVGAERLIEITGNDALTGFTAPKLVWVREHEPEVWARIAHVLLPKDYVRLQLTGEHAIDKADAAGTLLLDLAARDWSAEVLEALGIPASWLPPTFEGPEVTGTVTEAAAAETGLRAGTPVVAGGGDQSANGVGVGAVAPGHHRPVAGDVRRDLRQHRSAALRPARARPCLLPRRPGAVAHDVGDAVGRRQPALVPRRDRAGHRVRRSSWPASTRCRPAATACGSSPISPASAARTPTRWRAARSSA